MTHILLPFMVLILWSSLRRYGSDLERVASSLGAGRAVYLIRVFLPVSRSSIAAGTLLVFLLSVGFFITPALMGGGRGDTMMIAMLVEEQVNTLGRWRVGSALALLLMASVLLPMWVSWRWSAVHAVWQDLLSGGTDV
jgi:putative spermidine/putrescine transport system permease protein